MVFQTLQIPDKDRLGKRGQRLPSSRLATIQTRGAAPVLLKPQITFVCCVESGSLESQTVRMVTSLRKHGGQFANAPIVAVTPRFGPPLSKQTHRTFDALDVTYIRRTSEFRFSWFKFLNKPLSLVMTEEFIDSEVIGFLDSDLLFVDEPERLQLSPSEDFLGFPVECKEMATTGPGDPYEPFWEELCRIAAIDIGDLPWVVTAQTNQRVRLYFNGGVFVYRRSSGFAKYYLDLCLRFLESGVTSKAEGYGEGIKEMSALGLAVIKLGLRWNALPYSHNYVMMTKTHSSWYEEESLRKAKIVHYHDSMWPSFFSTFQDCLLKTHPEVAQWLTSLGPMRNDAPAQWRMVSRILATLRTRQEAAYRRSCSIA